ncbi:oxidoreductase alpha (Molybdopterin) subunit domain protein [Serratia marcescens]|nr:oxidoreductase alpha (Molybdopterin) subunit domain protein [Serratia marcescens]
MLVPLHYIDEESGTLSYKSVPIRVKLRSKEVRAIKIA